MRYEAHRACSKSRDRGDRAEQRRLGRCPVLDAVALRKESVERCEERRSVGEQHGDSLHHLDGTEPALLEARHHVHETLVRLRLRGKGSAHVVEEALRLPFNRRVVVVGIRAGPVDSAAVAAAVAAPPDTAVADFVAAGGSPAADGVPTSLYSGRRPYRGGYNT